MKVSQSLMGSHKNRSNLFSNAADDLLDLEENSDPETVNPVYRAFHTIKGHFLALGFNNLASLAHEVEELLSKIRSGEGHRNSLENILYSTEWSPKTEQIVITNLHGKHIGFGIDSWRGVQEPISSIPPQKELMIRIRSILI